MANVQDPPRPAGSAARERLRREQTFHDEYARHPKRLRARYYEWKPEEEAETFALSRLGALAGKSIVDYGCGSGRFSLRFAQEGARVLAFDLSPALLAQLAAAARAAGLSGQIHCQLMSGEQLAFADGSVELIYGQSILHHLDLEAARGEVLRVLAPGGRAVFLEPLVHNLLLRLYRWLTPRRRSADEHPLTMKEVERLGDGFRKARHREFCLAALLAAPLTVLPSRGLFRSVLRPLQTFDGILLRTWPGLGRFAWITVLELEK